MFKGLRFCCGTAFFFLQKQHQRGVFRGAVFEVAKRPKTTPTKNRPPKNRPYVKLLIDSPDPFYDVDEFDFSGSTCSCWMVGDQFWSFEQLCGNTKIQFNRFWFGWSYSPQFNHSFGNPQKVTKNWKYNLKIKFYSFKIKEAS